MKNSNFPKAHMISKKGGNAAKRQIKIIKSCLINNMSVLSFLFIDHDRLSF
tara:strand:- start:1629 stop:1781 length:153 start_codon:yes stop_codon:yes gene_type:complete